MSCRVPDDLRNVLLYHFGTTEPQLIHEAMEEMVDGNMALRGIIQGMADRIAAQSELLSKKAEKTEIDEEYRKWVEKHGGPN